MPFQWLSVQHIHTEYLSSTCDLLVVVCLPAPQVELTRSPTFEIFWLIIAGHKHFQMKYYIQYISILLPPATKLGQGYIFTGVCDSVNRGVSAPGGCLLPGGMVSAPGGGCLLRGGCLVETPPPRTATAAGGTHPTGMHSSIY